jgi:hypothetical protein
MHVIRDAECDKAGLVTMHMYTASRELPAHVIAFGYYSCLLVVVGLEWKIGSKVFCSNAAAGRYLEISCVFTVQIK